MYSVGPPPEQTPSRAGLGHFSNSSSDGRGRHVPRGECDTWPPCHLTPANGDVVVRNGGRFVASTISSSFQFPNAKKRLPINFFVRKWIYRTCVCCEYRRRAHLLGGQPLCFPPVAAEGAAAIHTGPLQLKCIRQDGTNQREQRPARNCHPAAILAFSQTRAEPLEVRLRVGTPRDLGQNDIRRQYFVKKGYVYFHYTVINIFAITHHRYCNSLSKGAVRCVLFELLPLELQRGEPTSRPPRFCWETPSPIQGAKTSSGMGSSSVLTKEVALKPKRRGRMPGDGCHVKFLPHSLLFLL
ncbi:uncharacterized protein LOC117027115 [Rhinolophus ferrumequinum]|uniref:uncharacterized protein LOC117027115 n=1 Tax=Rhinolophus ferrumequinum TaxID=59479 RepID=UPI00140FF1E5|nr:uncharacterized protein LOC117027115 [Rhinolophus ferrumequinum]